MKKKLRKILIISGTVLSSLLLVIILSSLFFYFNKPLTKRIVQKIISNKTGIELKIGKLNYGLFPLNVEAQSVKVLQNNEKGKVDIFLNQLSLKGKLKRLLKKQKPFFQSVEISGMDVMYRAGEVGGEIDYQKKLLMISNALSYLDKVNVKDFVLECIFSSNILSFQGGEVFLSGLEKKGEFNIIFNGEEGEIKNSDRNISLVGSFRSSGKLSFFDLPSLEGKVSFSPARLKFMEKEFSFAEVDCSFRAEFPLDGNVLSFPRLDIDVPPFADASGPLELDVLHNNSFLYRPKIHLRNFDKFSNLLMPFLKPYLPPDFKSLTLKGAASFEGECQYIASLTEKKTKVNGLVELEPTQISYMTSGFTFFSTISGKFQVKGTLPDMKFAGLLYFKNGSLFRDKLGIRNFSLDLSLEGTKSFFNISHLKGSLERFSFSQGDKKIELKQVTFDGEAGCNVEERKIDFRRLEFQVPSLPPVKTWAKIDLHSQGERYFHLKSSQMDLTSLSTLFSPFLPKEISDWEYDGQANLELEVKNSEQANDEWDFSGSLCLFEGTFNNASFTIAGESLQPKINLKGKYCSSDQSLSFSMAFHLSKGESLWNEYYVNWGKNPLRADIAGVYRIPLNKLDKFSIDASLFPLGRVEGHGILKFQQPHSFDLQISVTQVGLDSLYSFLSQEQESERSAIYVKGEAESQISFKKDMDRLSVFGKIRVKNGRIENKDKEFFMSGIEVELPFFYERQKGENSKGKELFLEKGSFHAGEVKTPYVSIAPFHIDLSAGENKFMIEPLDIEIFGGTATLGKSIFTLGPNPSEIHGILSFTLRDMDISKFPLKSDQFNLSGTIRIDLPKVIIDPEIIIAEGKGEVDIFDGRITVQNIKIAKPFSKNRTVFCDLDLKGLNLEKLTDSIPFGRVTGIINGEIKDMAFSYGQPEKFIILLESEKRKGIRQKFSVGAVNDLTVISEGEGVSLSSQKGLTRIIREFGYKKIGIFCSLKNDMFSLRGTIKEKGVEYLVKKSWLFGISVVNRKPGNRIRFKDMMNRLKRIGQSKKAK